MKIPASVLGHAAIGFLTFALYANTLGHPFHYDDVHSIVDNPYIRELGRIPSFFVDPTTFSHNADNAMYRPLLLAGFAVNYALGGYEVVGYHLVAIFLHWLCALLVGAIAKQMSGDAQAGLFAAALFAVHPIQSEPVNYISSRSEIQAAFFALLACAVYLRGGARSAPWVVAAFAAGVLSKSTAIVVPALLLAYKLLVERRWPESKGLFAALAGVAVLYLFAVRSMVLKATVGQPVRPYAEQFWTQVKAMVFYLKMLVWPSNQSVDHQFLISDSPFDPYSASAAFFLLSLIWWVHCRRRRHPMIALALAWFFIVLAPASLIPLNVLVNEHRLYLGTAALAYVACCGVQALRARLGDRWTLALCVAVLTAGSLATMQRNEVWRDEYALWGDAAAKAPLMARPQFHLAGAHARDGSPKQAIAALELGLQRDQGFSEGWARLAELHWQEGQVDLAARAIERGLAADRENGPLWALRAEQERAKGDWNSSLSAYERAVSLDPQDPALRNNLGNTYQVLGRAEDALKQHRRALALKAGDPETLLNLGNALQMRGEFSHAVRYYDRALAARDGYAGAWYNKGLALAALGLVKEALVALDRAEAIDDSYADAAKVQRRRLEGGR